MKLPPVNSTTDLCDLIRFIEEPIGAPTEMERRGNG